MTVIVLLPRRRKERRHAKQEIQQAQWIMVGKKMKNGSVAYATSTRSALMHDAQGEGVYILLFHLLLFARGDEGDASEPAALPSDCRGGGGT
jgi:hypothetical protein